YFSAKPRRLPPKPAADSPREPQHPLCAPFPPFTVFSDFSVIFSPYFGLDAAGLEIVCFPVFPAAIVVYALRCSPACRTRRAHTARRPHAPRVGRLPQSVRAAAAPRRRRLRPAPPAPLVERGAAQGRGGPAAAAIGGPALPLSAAGAWAAAALGRGEPRGRERGRLRPYLSGLPEPLTSFELETGCPLPPGLPRTRPGTEPRYECLSAMPRHAQQFRDHDTNPCIAETDASRKCMDDNNYKKDMCTDYFLKYKSCRKFWHNIMIQRRRNGVKPEMPSAEERKKILESMGKPY
uniref:Coiled-coil-helix-coiled-coil-helix domain-containing protein 7 n=2 Tax=Falco TaxID=8952 RepID=A0A8C4UH03_FALTI